MSSQSKKKLAEVFTLLVLILTAFQALIPEMPIANPKTITLVSAVTMFLVSALTAWKQYIAPDIMNRAVKPTLFIAIIATIGGLNELFAVIPFSETTGQWIRFAITAVTAILNIVSKAMWPAETESRMPYNKT